jgi:hypothetical protein
VLDAYQDLIDELLGTPTEIRGLVEAAGDAAAPPEAIQLIAELGDRDRAILERIQRITREQDPFLKTWQLPARPAVADVNSVLDQLELARGDLVSILINLSLKDWARTAIDETEGEETLADEIERHVEFDETQRARVRAIMGRASE